MDEKPKSPSSSYQSFFKEVNVDPANMDLFRSGDSVTNIESDIKSEQINEVKTSLIVRICELAEQHLTDVQRDVFRLRMVLQKSFIDVATIRREDYSNWESSYTSSYYAEHGQRNYSKDRGTYGKYYGGYLMKLQKRCQKDPIIKKLLVKLQKINPRPIKI